MSVLITGATGVHGRAPRPLARRGSQVRGLVRPASRDGADTLAGAGMEIALGDLTDPASLAPACAGVDVVYHIVASYRTAG